MLRDSALDLAVRAKRKMSIPEKDLSIRSRGQGPSLVPRLGIGNKLGMEARLSLVYCGNIGYNMHTSLTHTPTWWDRAAGKQGV